MTKSSSSDLKFDKEDDRPHIKNIPFHVFLF